MLDVEHEFTVSAEKVWSLLEDFGNIEAWWPSGGAVDIERVEVEGQGIGMIRHMHNAGMAKPVSEQLDAMDSSNHILKLSIVGDRPAGLVEYHATGRLLPTPEGRCILSYHGEFRAEPGREEEAKDFLVGAYELMFNGLQAAASGNN